MFFSVTDIKKGIFDIRTSLHRINQPLIALLFFHKKYLLMFIEKGQGVFFGNG